MSDDGIVTCKYRRGGGKPCGEPADTTLTVDVLDHPSPPSCHHYCRRHGQFAETDFLLAVSMVGRLDQVRLSIQRHPFPIMQEATQ